MVDIIKLKDLGFDVDYLPNPQSRESEHIVHHMLRGYKKFNEDYIHLLADHAHHVLGVEDKEHFRKNLLEKAQNKERDDVLHCALSILSIHHRKKHHEEKGHGVSFPEAHRVVVSFMKESPEKVKELQERFPHITEDVLDSVIPANELEEMSA